MGLGNTAKTWGGLSKVFHWTIGLMILGLLPVGLYMEQMEFSPLKLQIYAVHKAVGMTVLALVAGRILWKAVTIRPEELETHALWERKLASFIHVLLYIGMIGMPLSGWLMSSAANYPVSMFGLFTLPDLIAPSEDMNKLMKQVHMICGYALMAAVGLHIAGALKHHVIDRDETVTRMLPRIGAGIPIVMILALIGFLGAAQIAQTEQQQIVETQEIVREEPVDKKEEIPVEDVAPHIAAPAPEWEIIPGESQVTFKAIQQSAEFEGSFATFDGLIRFDPDNLVASKIDVTVDIEGVATGSQDRDGYITASAWLAAKAYPQARFESHEIVNQDTGYLAKGTLTIKGISHPLDLPFTVTFSEDTAHAGGEFKIQRLDFNVGEGEWSDTSSVGNDVTVMINVHAEKK